MFGSGKPRGLDRDRALGAKPERALAVSSEKADDGGLTLVVELEPKKWLRWLGVSGKVRRTFGLDALGAEVYNACDGKTTVRSIVRRFAKEHKISVAEAEISVTQYLQTLVSKALVLIAVDRAEKKA